MIWFIINKKVIRMNEKYNMILLQSLEGSHYLTSEDIRMNKKFGFCLSNIELKKYLKYKEVCENKKRIELPLKSFNSNKVYYYENDELNSAMKDYVDYFLEDIKKESTIILDNNSEMLISRIASELEGTLRIEGVNTTRKKIMDVYKSNKAQNRNEQIVINMINGYKFINEKPEFNKDNLFKLYKFLSYNCLNPEDEIKEYYRTEMVEIGGHDGADVDKIEECMDSLFNLVNESLSTKKVLDTFLLPMIAHYYVLYVHPYMDYNGRTARMVSLWISILFENEFVYPTYISEAINDDKSNYYKAIDNSRNSNNDLTYFMIYIMKLANQYYLVYKNISAIKESMAVAGDILTNTEVYYLKRIIINKNLGWFNYKSFISFSNINITKQGALKILNYFLSLDLLISKTNKRNEKIFKMNEDKLLYTLD